MKKMILGNTDMEVTELCFGALPMGPLQKNVPLQEGIDLIAEALKQGVNFIDTAQVYRTYPYIKGAIDKTGIRPIIATKSAASSYEDMEHAINEALEALGVSCIDIFLLHAARADTDVFEKRADALKCLLDYKAKGIIRAVGISLHDVRVVKLAAERADIDVVFAILNKIGMGILNGTTVEMEEAINQCFANHKAVYFMKALAGGNLVREFVDSINYVRDFSAGRGPLSVGMVSKEELDLNLRFFNGEQPAVLTTGATFQSKQFLPVKSLCKGCGECVKACHSGAISISDKVAVIDREKCLTCGYCVGSCSQFAIRMI